MESAIAVSPAGMMTMTKMMMILMTTKMMMIWMTIGRCHEAEGGNEKAGNEDLGPNGAEKEIKKRRRRRRRRGVSAGEDATSMTNCL